MAKKKKTRQVTIPRRSPSNHSWERASSSQAIMAARGFKPFDFLVRRCPELSELVVEIDQDAEIATESRQKIVRLAQLILSGNVISKKAAQGKKDVAWVQASWAHPEGANRLDPISTFEVGVAVARNQRPLEECEKAARFLRFEESLPEGLSMIPDADGNHVNVPMLGILLKPSMVEVRREGKVVGTASVWHTLIGFEERDKIEFAKPTKEEKLERGVAEAAERERAKAEKKAADKARRERDKLEELGSCFEDVWDEWEEAEEERKRHERTAQWREFVAANEELRSLWETCREASNASYESDKEVIEALQLVLRPKPPGKADLLKALPYVRDYLQELSGEHAKFRWTKLMTWVKDVSGRRDLSLSASLTKANTDLPWLLPHWFVEENSAVCPLYPLKNLVEYEREEWIGRVALDPVLDDESKGKLFSLAGED